MTRHNPEGVRERILSATIDSLAEVGHAATTTLEVQRRAGISRGTLQHHYPTRNALLAAVVDEIGARRHAEVAHAAVRRRHARPLDEALVDLRLSFSSATFYAELELWVAARCDADLRTAVLPIERRLGQEMSALLAADFEAFPESLREDALRVAVDVMRGMASTDGLRRKRSKQEIRHQLAPLIHLFEYVQAPKPHDEGALR